MKFVHAVDLDLVLNLLDLPVGQIADQQFRALRDLEVNLEFKEDNVQQQEVSGEGEISHVLLN